MNADLYCVVNELGIALLMQVDFAVVSWSRLGLDDLMRRTSASRCPPHQRPRRQRCQKLLTDRFAVCRSRFLSRHLAPYHGSCFEHAIGYGVRWCLGILN